MQGIPFLTFNQFQLIPDYDRISNPSPIPPIYHGDIEVTSEILKLRVSFKWRPFVDDNVTETMRFWAFSDQNEQPDWIFFSKNSYSTPLYYRISNFLYCVSL